MSKLFILYILLGVVFTLGSAYLQRRKEKRLARYLSQLEETINSNATICNKQFNRIDCLVILQAAQDPLLEDKLSYLQKRIAAHKKSPKHYPLEPKRWLAAFEFAHPKNASNHEHGR